MQYELVTNTHNGMKVTELDKLLKDRKVERAKGANKKQDKLKALAKHCVDVALDAVE